MNVKRIARGVGVALVSMAAFTSMGVHAAPDSERGREILKQAKLLADNGNANAQYNFGVLYDEGIGVEKDYDQALEWYRKAAEQEYAKAEHNLGIMYQEGHGVDKDPVEASRWFQLAAQHGEPAAQNNLAVMYVRGQGVAPDLGKAAYWSARAARAGNESARTNLPLIVEELPQSRIDGNNVNIRGDASKNGRVMRQASANTRVTLLAQKGSWIRVLFPDDYTVGWVADFLLADSAAPLRNKPSETQAAAQSEEPDQVANEESASSPAEAESTESQQVTAEQPQNDAMVAAAEQADAGATGSNSAVSGGTGSDSAQTTQKAGPRLRVATDVLNVREGPSTGAGVVAKAQHNETATLVDSSGGWRKLRFDDGRTGWAAGFLLKKK